MTTFVTNFSLHKYYQRIIANAEKRLVLLLPFLRLDSGLQSELGAEQKGAVDILIVYSHSRMLPEEAEWVAQQGQIRLRRCGGLNMRCCLSEEELLIASRGPFPAKSERHDMGFYLRRSEEPTLYKAAYDDIYRIVGESRSSSPTPHRPVAPPQPEDLLSDWVIAQRMHLTLEAYYTLLTREGYLQEGRNGRLELTDKGIEVGGKTAFSNRYGPYFLWPRGE